MSDPVCEFCGRYRHWLRRGFGWTKEEYDAAPEVINRLHTYILDLEEEVRRVCGIADEYSADFKGTNAGIRLALIAQRLDWIVKGCEVTQRVEDDSEPDPGPITLEREWMGR